MRRRRRTTRREKQKMVGWTPKGVIDRYRYQRQTQTETATAMNTGDTRTNVRRIATDIDFTNRTQRERDDRRNKTLSDMRKEIRKTQIDRHEDGRRIVRNRTLIKAMIKTRKKIKLTKPIKH